AVDGLLLGEPAGDERCGGRTVDDRRVAKQPFADDGLLALREQLASGGHLLDDTARKLARRRLEVGDMACAVEGAREALGRRPFGRLAEADDRARDAAEPAPG